jgi:hypothetical protein
MKKIALTRGFESLVDDEDYDKLNKYKWYCNKRGYAVRSDYSGSKTSNVKMHRFIMNTPFGMETDHINGDKLDNRRSNLRICTHSQNSKNRKINSNSSCGLKGVTRYVAKLPSGNLYKSWVAAICLNGKRIYIGSFKTPELAHEAYVKKSLELHGEFSRIN